jgi:Ca2+-binding RTX toxin-like protein
LYGGPGDDTFLLEDVSGQFNIYDTVAEFAGEGTDTVKVKGLTVSPYVNSYTLAAEIEIGIVNSAVGFNLTGNSLANTLTGNDGLDTLKGAGNNDILNGGGGFDDLYGGADHDTYYLYDVDSLGRYDVVHEDVGEGTDTVHIKAASNGSAHVSSYTLTDNVEIGIVDDAQDFHLSGNELSNSLTGNLGDDQLDGLGGNDTLRGGGGFDQLSGGGGNDTYYLTDVTPDDDSLIPHYSYDSVFESDGAEGGLADVVYVSAVQVNRFTLVHSYTLADNVETVFVTGRIGMTVIGNNIGDNMQGNVGADHLIGGDGRNILSGLGGNDTLTGSGNQDILTGGAGKDVLTGGGDADTFRFNVLADSKVGATRDVIKDFTQGGTETRDKIDLFAIDANHHTGLNQAFHLIGTADFSSHGSHHAYGEVRYHYESGNTIIEGDVNGNGVADFQIELTGLYTLAADDFRL